MLLTNVIRSASYEAFPNHRLFPARSGSTNRLWEKADETAAIYFGKAKCACGGKKLGCCGSTELAIVVARRSWREISCCKTEKLTKFREHLSQSR